MIGTVGGNPAHPARTGSSAAGVSSRTPVTPVQPTRSRGWSGQSGQSGAFKRSAGPGGTGWSSSGGRMPRRFGRGVGRAGAGAGGSATISAYPGIVFFFLLIHLFFQLL